MKFLLAAIMMLGAVASRAQLCPTCIQNSAAPQNAQIDIGTAVVRGTLTASTGTFININATSMNVTNLSGAGSAITALNASSLASGVVAAARLVGSYTGITAVGTLVTGLWNGSVVGTQYGGTGQNFVTADTGSIPYFSAVGTMTVLSPSTAGKVLQTNGSAAPSWTAAPQVVGTNVTAIPLANLSAGTLPINVLVSSTSLPASIPAASIIGNIPGGAATLTIALPVANLAGGTFTSANPASSVTATGVVPGTYGGPLQMAQLQVRSDGRVQTAAQYLLTVPTANISTGALPSGVTIAAADVSTGTLHAYVVASSVSASGVIPGSYGSATRTVVLTVQSDGRITTSTSTLIALPAAQVVAGSLPAGVTIGASDIRAGSLPGSVVATSVAVTGVASGVYGSATSIPQITVTNDGRITSATQTFVPSLSTSVARVNVDNNWSHAQTSQSSWTINAAITASSFVGDGTSLTGLVQKTGDTMTGTLTMSGPTANIVAGASVTASAFFGNGSNLTGLASSSNKLDKVGTSSLTITGANGYITVQSSVTASAFFGDGSALTGVTGAGAVLRTGDSMTGPLTISTNTPGTTSEVLSLYNSSGAARVGLYSNLASSPVINIGYYVGAVPTPIGVLKAYPNSSNQPIELAHNTGTAVVRVRGDNRVGLVGDTDVYGSMTVTSSVTVATNLTVVSTVTAGVMVVSTSNASSSTGFYLSTLSNSVSGGYARLGLFSGAGGSSEFVLGQGSTPKATIKYGGTLDLIPYNGAILSNVYLRLDQPNSQAILAGDITDTNSYFTAGVLKFCIGCSTPSTSSKLTIKTGTGTAGFMDVTGSVAVGTNTFNGGLERLRVLGAVNVLGATPLGYAVQVSSPNGNVIFGITGGGHVVSSGTIPSIVCDAGTGLMEAGSNDMSGAFTAGAAATTCTITLSTVATKRFKCFTNDRTTITTIRALTSTTDIVFDSTGPFGGDVIDYGCIGAP